MSLSRALFHLFIKDPKPGEEWVKLEENPFLDASLVKIREVRGNWVAYVQGNLKCEKISYFKTWYKNNEANRKVREVVERFDASGGTKI